MVMIEAVEFSGREVLALRMSKTFKMPRKHWLVAGLLSITCSGQDDFVCTSYKYARLCCALIAKEAFVDHLRWTGENEKPRSLQALKHVSFAVYIGAQMTIPEHWWNSFEACIKPFSRHGTHSCVALFCPAEGQHRRPFIDRLEMRMRSSNERIGQGAEASVLPRAVVEVDRS